jgi:hypothetical protein
MGLQYVYKTLHPLGQTFLVCRLFLGQLALNRNNNLRGSGGRKHILMPVQRAHRRLRKCKLLLRNGKFSAFPTLTSPPVTCNITWMD